MLTPAAHPSPVDDSAFRNGGVAVADPESMAVPAATLKRRTVATIGRSVAAVFGVMCLLGLLAVTATIPILNLVVLGILLACQGRVAVAGRFREAFRLLPAARHIAVAVVLVSLWLLIPSQLANVAYDVSLVAPDSAAAMLWAVAAAVTTVLIAGHLLLAVMRGARWWHFFRPWNNVMWLRRHRSLPEASRPWDEIVASLAELQLVHQFVTGLRALFAAAVILALPTYLFTQFGLTAGRWQIWQVVFGFLLLIPCWLLAFFDQADVAARGVRRLPSFRAAVTLYRCSPLLWNLVIAALLAVSTLPLLYESVIKQRIPPHHAWWDVTTIFVVTVFPLRLLIGRLHYRASRRTTARTWWLVLNFPLTLAALAGYFYFLYLAATGGELGVRALWQHHALLLPWMSSF